MMDRSSRDASEAVELRSKKLKQGVTDPIWAASQAAVSYKKHKQITELPIEIQRIILGFVLLNTEVFVGEQNGDLDFRPTREILHRDNFEETWHWPDKCTWRSAIGAFQIWRDMRKKHLFYQNCKLVFVTAKSLISFMESITARERMMVRAIEIRPLAVECSCPYNPQMEDRTFRRMWRAGILQLLDLCEATRSVQMAFTSSDVMGQHLTANDLFFVHLFIDIQADLVEMLLPRLESAVMEINEFVFDNGICNHVFRTYVQRGSRGPTVRFEIEPIDEQQPYPEHTSTVSANNPGDVVFPQFGPANQIQLA